MVLRLPDSWSNWSLEMLVFEKRGKPEYPEKNLSEQGREPKTNSTHIWRRRRELKPGHIGGRRVLSPLHHPCSPNSTKRYQSSPRCTKLHESAQLAPNCTKLYKTAPVCTKFHKAAPMGTKLHQVVPNCTNLH